MTGEAGIESCCAAGHYCHVYSQWWSSCTLGDNGSNTPAPATPTPAPVESPAESPTEPTTNAPGVCVCVSKVGHISDEWCAAANCDPAYGDFCELSCGGNPAPTPTPAPETPATPAAPAPVTTPAPETPATTAAPAPVTSPTQQPVTPPPADVDDFAIMGYVENWRDFSDMSKYDSYTHLLYSFLTLDSAPFPDDPRDMQWDGQAIYETMT